MASKTKMNIRSKRESSNLIDGNGLKTYELKFYKMETHLVDWRSQDLGSKGQLSLR